MNAFIVQLTHRPGELARLTEAIAQKGIDITSLGGATCGDSGAVALITNDESTTRKVLESSGFDVREIELVSASLDNRPGTLADAARKLADAGINIEAVIPTGMSGNKVTVAFATDQPARARSIVSGGVAAAASTR
jgi:hypothetical protein